MGQSGASSETRYPSLIAPTIVIVLLVAALAFLLFAQGHSPEPGATAPTATRTASPVATLLPSTAHSQTPMASQTPTATATATRTVTPTRMPTNTPTATATLSPTPISDHYWLSRPVPPDAEATTVSRFYPYGSRGDGTYPIHHGVEFVNPTGTPLLAVADGTVIVAGDDSADAYGPWTNFYGLLVVLRLEQAYDGKPIFVLYGHLSEVTVEVGQRVQVGDQVGKVGMTGVAMGPHLHFEVRVGENSYDNTRNPELWLRPQEGAGTIAVRVLDASESPIPETLVTVHHAESPDERWKEITTYPLEEVNPDDHWRESQALGGVPEGGYVLRVHIGERYYRSEVLVKEGKTALVNVRVEE